MFFSRSDNNNMCFQGNIKQFGFGVLHFLVIFIVCVCFLLE